MKIWEDIDIIGRIALVTAIVAFVGCSTCLVCCPAPPPVNDRTCVIRYKDGGTESYECKRTAERHTFFGRPVQLVVYAEYGTEIVKNLDAIESYQVIKKEKTTNADEIED